ncbi:Pkinase-domain-containing protein [Gyrodon lividus]|nr:Pkinase-domain-containing protein [Gyrodon lividus]
MANKSNNDSDDQSSSPVASAASESMDRGRSRVRQPSNQLLEHYSMKKRGYHTFMSSFGKVFHVEKRWKLIREMGSGAYGVVVSAADEISGETVAIKLVTRVFEKVQLAKRALREITLLRHFANHENITGLIDVDAISPDFQEIYIFMEPMEADLHQIIKSGQTLTNEHVQYFLYQILRGMKYIHSASVIHRDLKPGNLLVNSDCELKICDFGLSRGFDAVPDEHTSGHLTEYVATRWYRAPEIMLAFRGYTTAIDVWSIGCIFAELLLGRPLFKGKDYVDQVNKILDVLGTPGESVIHRIGSDKVSDCCWTEHEVTASRVQQAQAYIRSLPVKEGVPLRKLLPTADLQALDLLEKMITFDPTSRIAVLDALSHPWLASYHEESDEPYCPTKFERWRDIEKLETLEEFREALWKEIEDYRMDVRGLKPEAASPGKSIKSPMTEAGSTPLDVSLPRVSSPKQEGDAIDTLVPPTTTSELLRSTTPTDPVVTYARRSSILPPARQSSTSTYNSPLTSTIQHPLPTMTDGLPTTSGHGVAFPSETYVVPARSRAASTTGGDISLRKLLRTLSTVSIHESVEGLPDGLAGVAPIGQFITGQKSDADAPPSEMPMEFADKGGQDDDSGDGR